jgi:Flp pilus assembly protein TadD
LRDRSVQEYLAMAAADPSRPDGLLMASQARHKMFHKREATALARQARTRYPKDRRVREQLATLLTLSHNRGAATQICQEWLAEEPQALPPLWMLGYVAATERDFPGAIRSYEQALARKPDDLPALEGLGGALLETPTAENLPRAVAALTRASALAPESAQTRYRLGLALMHQGRLEEAQRQMLRSLDLDPNRGEAYNVLVQLSRRLRQPGTVELFGPMVREVEERLREELRLWRRTWDTPEDAAAYPALARFLLRNADPERAESQLEQALALRPGWREAQVELARVRRILEVL